MNTRQQERFEELGRTFHSALEDIIDMGGEEKICVEEECQQEEPVPMPVDMNANLAHYEVSIKHVHNGFIVSVGCQTFVFESFDKMAKYMAIYYNDPQGTIEKHYKGELLK
jgi:hypothetical protein